MKNILVLYNPSSAGGKSLKRMGKIKKKFEKLKIPYDFHITKSEKDLREMASNAAGEKKNIIAVGGDTTFTFVAEEILRSENRNEVTLGMIGTGSFNDIVRGIGMDDIDSLLDGINNGLTHKIDVGIVRTGPEDKKYYFLGSLGVGLGTIVNKYVENWKNEKIMITKIKPAMEISGFIKGVRQSFTKNKVPINVLIEWGNRKIERNLSLLVFQNTPLYGRSLKISPDASPYDNIIDCAIINTRSLSNTIGLAVSVMRSKHMNRPELEILRSSEFKVSSAKEIDIVIDGEIIENVKNFRVSLLKSGLNIYRPKKIST
ncbi:MAG: hypothetical protein KAR14_08305 [Candidatus Aminicenantes bacterium]|nr:hypothetical protein [Candidatus Aminicenantes bacterium]